MPCRSDHMDPTPIELKFSRVLTLLDEVAGRPFNKHHYEGYHPNVYSKTTVTTPITHGDALERIDYATAELCEILARKNVRAYSLELQMWWRNHLLADDKRKKAEKLSTRRQEIIDRAIAKLTDEEKEALDL